MFGYLLLYRWACSDKRVVVVKRHLHMGKPLLLCKEGAFVLDEEAYARELEDPAVM